MADDLPRARRLQFKKTIYCISFSPDGDSIAGGTSDATIQIFSMPSGQPTGAPLKGHTDSINSVAYSQDGRKIASASDDHTVRVWDAVTRKDIGVMFPSHPETITSARFLSDGRRIISVLRYGTILIWDHESGQLTQEFQLDFGGMAVTALSSDARKLVGARTFVAGLWDMETGSQIAKLTGQSPSMLLSTACSPDASQIVFGLGDDTLRVWDVKAGGKLGEPYRGHTDIPNHVAYAPDSQRVASVAGDGTLRVWDTTTRRCVAGPVEGSDPIAFSPDGKYLASQAIDGTLRIRNVTETSDWSPLSLDLDDLPAAGPPKAPETKPITPASAPVTQKPLRGGASKNNRSASYDSILDLPAIPQPGPHGSESRPKKSNTQPPETPNPDPAPKPKGLKGRHQLQNLNARPRSQSPNVALGQADDRLVIATPRNARGRRIERRRQERMRQNISGSDSESDSELSYQGPLNYICFCLCFK
ncbi:WD40 repeat-like protein [Leucogyrophana mollusca]|uniref:WD40 repeat-like protein n=1 Tax=Leucogyrophana mollusca TaxID=85980 RepID=A0ACB8BJQ2_9AGAM|nr:WD40 repeat-like protein [Leucogyrophana mollusca]